MSSKPCSSPFHFCPRVRIDVVRSVRFSIRPCPLSRDVADRSGAGVVGMSSGGSGRRDGSGGGGEGESGLDVDLQSGLVVLHGQDGIAPGIDRLGRRIALAEHGIADHDFARERQDPQEFQSRFVFVGLGVHTHPGQYRARGRRVRGDQMLARHIAVPTAAERLAVDRDLLEGRRVEAAADPGREYGFEPGGIEAAEGVGDRRMGGGFAPSEAEGVSRGGAVPASEPRDADDARAAHEHGQNDEAHHGGQRVDAAVAAAGIRECRQGVEERTGVHGHLAACKIEVPQLPSPSQLDKMKQ